MKIDLLRQQLERLLENNNFNYSAPEVVALARELEDLLFKNSSI